MATSFAAAQRDSICQTCEWIRILARIFFWQSNGKVEKFVV